LQGWEQVFKVLKVQLLDYDAWVRANVLLLMPPSSTRQRSPHPERLIPVPSDIAQYWELRA
jgi:hypothetical protein